MILLIIIFVGLTKSDEPGSNPVLFTQVGPTTLKTGYGHMVVPLKLDVLKQSYDKFADMESSVSLASSWTPEGGTHKKARLEKMREKLDVIQHLTKSFGRTTHFEEYDNQNIFNTSLFQVLGEDVTNWKPATMAPLTTTKATTANSGRKKRDSEIPEKLLKLAGFGLQMFNTAKLQKIKEVADGGEEESNIVASTTNLNFLRISGLDKTFKAVYDKMSRLVTGSSSIKLGTTGKMFERELDLMASMLSSELDLYLMGIQSLLDGRFSPVLANPDMIQSKYETILEKARRKGFQPLSEDAGTIFQSETSVIGTEEGELICVIHIPLYSGALMGLYRYVSAPFLLQDGVVATIKSEKEFLVMDPSGTIGKEMSL